MCKTNQYYYHLVLFKKMTAPGLSTELKGFLFSSWLYILGMHLLKNGEKLGIFSQGSNFFFFLNLEAKINSTYHGKL